MRFQLLIVSLLVVGVIGRRGAEPPAPPKQTRMVFTQWGYPYGWGLTIPEGEDAGGLPEEDVHKKMKEVKRGT